MLIAFLTIVSLLSTMLGGVYYGMYLYKTKRAETFLVFLENAIQSRFAVVPHFIEGKIFGRPDRLTIQIKPKHFRHLATKRQAALESGILLTETEDFVPATILHDGKTIGVKMRLKGDWTDHLLGNKWSFRVKVKGAETLYGMKQFSLHHPRARQFAYEWLYHKALRREEVTSLRYDFVEVMLNDKSLGIYAIEEHFEKRLIENNQRREGPIIKLNENLMWADRSAQRNSGTNSPTGLQSEHASQIDVFKSSEILKNPGLYRQFKVAHNLLEAFRYGELPTHKVFDTVKLARFLAISDLLGAQHAMMWQNMRFYYNPVTSLLEPIGFDANAGKRTQELVGSNRGLRGDVKKFKDNAFSDPVFFEEYVRTLERVSADGYVESLLEDVHDELQKRLRIVYREFPYFHFSEDVLHRNRETIRLALNPVKGLHAYFRQCNNGQLQIEAGTIQGMPVEIIEVSHAGSDLFLPSERVLLPAKDPAFPVEYETISLPYPFGFRESTRMAKQLKIRYRILGTRKTYQDEVFSWPRRHETFAEGDLMRLSPNADEFEFIRVDESRKRILITPGSWAIHQNLLLPAGYQVVCGEGTRLNLMNSALILSYSPLDFLGSEEAPILIESEDGTGQGLVIMMAQEESRLQYVSFNGLRNPSQGGWSLTGAVTFYESPVQISNCRFMNNQSEDALNIVRTTYGVQHSLFSRTSSDAFDADFANGSFENCVFAECGNDGIDISGSTVEVSGTRFDGIGDKALSAGENSTMIARHIDIDKAAIAVASKDFSEVRITDLHIVDSEVGFTVFQKKPEFGPANVKVEGLEMKNVEVPHLVEVECKLVLDGSRIDGKRHDVKDILYGVAYGKSSR